MAVAASAPLPSFYAVHQTPSPWSLHSSSPLRSRPQPLGSGGDVSPCEDTREDFGLSFLKLPATTCCCRVAFNVSLRNVQQDCGGFGGHGSAPGGASSSPVGRGTAGSTGSRDPGTFQGVGGCRGSRVAVPLETGDPWRGDQPTDWRAPSQETTLTMGIHAECAWYVGWWATFVTGARTSGIAGMLGSWSSLKGGPPPRATGPRSGGHQPKDW